VASYSSTRVPQPILPYYAFAMKGVRVHMVQAMNMPRGVRDAGARTILALLDRGVLRPRIARRFTLRDIAEAHELLEGGGAIGNLVIEFPV
jgi:NADPH:quinone reductase-like Zn-dependent oxidoreductase